VQIGNLENWLQKDAVLCHLQPTSGGVQKIKGVKPTKIGICYVSMACGWSMG
jgi:hypothetical protein